VQNFESATRSLQRVNQGNLDASVRCREILCLSTFVIYPRSCGNGVTPSAYGVPDPLLPSPIQIRHSQAPADGGFHTAPQQPRGAGLAGHVLPRRAAGGTANGGSAHAPRGRSFAPDMAVSGPAALSRGAGDDDGTG